MNQDTGAAIGVVVLLLFYLAIIVVVIAGIWKMLEKANQPGWGALIPIYNMVLMLRVASMPLWWILVMFIPFANIIPGFLMPYNIAKNFGKGIGFAIGLIFLPMIFYPILGFGSAEYCPAGLPLMGQSSYSDEQPQYAR